MAQKASHGRRIPAGRSEDMRNSALLCRAVYGIEGPSSWPETATNHFIDASFGPCWILMLEGGLAISVGTIGIYHGGLQP